jgi:hypothetical protein
MNKKIYFITQAKGGDSASLRGHLLTRSLLLSTNQIRYTLTQLPAMILIPSLHRFQTLIYR